MIHYHGGRHSTQQIAVEIWRRRHALVSFADAGQLPIASEVSQSFAVDNGAFSVWKQDYADIAPAVRPVLGMLHHGLLNDVPGLDNPTTEHLAPWIYRRIKPMLPALTAIEVAESATTGCVFEP